MTRYLIILFLLCAICTVGYNQVSDQSNTADERFKGIIYRNESALDLRLHTRGFAVAYNSGKIKTYYRTQYYHLEFSTMHDAQEEKQTKNGSIVEGEIQKGFKYGKQNSVFMLRAGKGTKRYITEKARRKGVSIGYNFEIGPSLAILKPYFLKFTEQIIVNGEFKNILVEKKYTKDNAAQFLDYRLIYGGTSFVKGIKEIGFIPGAQTKLGLFFSAGTFEKYVRAAEIGVMADLFLKKVPIMVETSQNKNSPLFINLYVNLHFGKRSN